MTPFARQRPDLWCKLDFEQRHVGVTDVHDAVLTGSADADEAGTADRPGARMITGTRQAARSEGDKDKGTIVYMGLDALAMRQRESNHAGPVILERSLSDGRIPEGASWRVLLVEELDRHEMNRRFAKIRPAMGIRRGVRLEPHVARLIRRLIGWR